MSDSEPDNEVDRRRAERLAVYLAAHEKHDAALSEHFTNAVDGQPPGKPLDDKAVERIKRLREALTDAESAWPSSWKS